MGLDLYAGTLTRYYSRNWKTTVQQWAEENGYAYSRMGPDGPMEQEQRPDPAEVQGAMESWRDSILGILKNSGAESPSWPEDNEAPYYTDKPDWDAWYALLLAAASWYAVTFQEGRLVYPMDFSVYTFQAGDLPMWLAIGALWLYVLALSALLLRALWRGRRSPQRFTRTLSPRPGLLGALDRPHPLPLQLRGDVAIVDHTAQHPGPLRRLRQLPGHFHRPSHAEAEAGAFRLDHFHPLTSLRE